MNEREMWFNVLALVRTMSEETKNSWLQKFPLPAYKHEDSKNYPQEVWNARVANIYVLTMLEEYKK
jgi:hypothetical protein